MSSSAKPGLPALLGHCPAQLRGQPGLAPAAVTGDDRDAEPVPADTPVVQLLLFGLPAEERDDAVLRFQQIGIRHAVLPWHIRRTDIAVQVGDLAAVIHLFEVVQAHSDARGEVVVRQQTRDRQCLQPAAAVHLRVGEDHAEQLQSGPQQGGAGHALPAGVGTLQGQQRRPVDVDVVPFGPDGAAGVDRALHGFDIPGTVHRLCLGIAKRTAGHGCFAGDLPPAQRAAVRPASPRRSGNPQYSGVADAHPQPGNLGIDHCPVEHADGDTFR